MYEHDHRLEIRTTGAGELNDVPGGLSRPFDWNSKAFERYCNAFLVRCR